MGNHWIDLKEKKIIGKTVFVYWPLTADLCEEAVSGLWGREACTGEPRNAGWSQCVP